MTDHPGRPPRRAANPSLPELVALDEVIARSDLLILCAPHSAYRDLDFAGKPVVDVWGFLTKANVLT